MNYTAKDLGDEVRARRIAHRPAMTQKDLARAAGYGKGGEVSISRIESGLARPTATKLDAIAVALGASRKDLEASAATRASTPREEPESQPSKLRDRVAQTKRRHAAVMERVAERSRITQELLEKFTLQHDSARDDFFLEFVALGTTISGAPEPTHESDGPQEGSTGSHRAEIRVEAMTAQIGSAIQGAVGGGLFGAATGGAAAYAAFSAVAAFGTASTGAAISGLSGVAATNATLAVLGGGTLAAGGAGMAGGAMLLTGMVAAPAAALAAGGFLYLRHRRTKSEEERLRSEVASAEEALDESQAGFSALVGTLEEATEIVAYLALHASHALSRWRSTLPPEPRHWDDMSEGAQRRYGEFLTLAACLLSISRIDLSALMTATPDQLERMTTEIDDTLTYASRTAKELV